MTPTELLTHRVCLSRIGDEVLPGSYLSRSITSHYLCLRGFPRHYSVCTDATLDARARPLQHGRQNRLPKVPGLPSTEHSPSVDTVVQESSKLFAYCTVVVNLTTEFFFSKKKQKQNTLYDQVSKGTLLRIGE